MQIKKQQTKEPRKKIEFEKNRTSEDPENTDFQKT